jgi:hypothetical protein
MAGIVGLGSAAGNEIGRFEPVLVEARREVDTSTAGVANVVVVTASTFARVSDADVVVILLVARINVMDDDASTSSYDCISNVGPTAATSC